MIGCKFQLGSMAIQCYEGCELARIAGESRICEGSEYDPAGQEWRTCPTCDVHFRAPDARYVTCPYGHVTQFV